MEDTELLTEAPTKPEDHSKQAIELLKPAMTLQAMEKAVGELVEHMTPLKTGPKTAHALTRLTEAHMWLQRAIAFPDN